MAKKYSGDVSVFYDGYDLGTASIKVALSLQADALDVTALGDAAERQLASLRKDALEWSGLFDDNLSADAAHAALTGLGTGVFSVLLGAGTGDVAYAGTAFLLEGKAPASIGDLVKYELAFRPDQSLDRGIHYGPRINKAGTGAQTSGTHDNSTLTTAGGVFYVHILVASGGTIDGYLQDSADGTTWADVTSALISGTGRKSGKASFTGTLRRYTRLNYAGTGTGTTLGVMIRS